MKRPPTRGKTANDSETKRAKQQTENTMERLGLLLARANTRTAAGLALLWSLQFARVRALLRRLLVVTFFGCASLSSSDLLRSRRQAG